MPLLIHRGWIAAALLAVAGPVLVAPGAIAQVAASSNAKVPVDGTVNAANENVRFSGGLVVEARVIQDSVFRNPDVLELVIDFKEVKGTGQSSRQSYLTQAQAVVTRPLLAFDAFEVTFPYSPGANPNAARTAVVSIEVGLDKSGKLIFRDGRVRNF